MLENAPQKIVGLVSTPFYTALLGNLVAGDQVDLSRVSSQSSLLRLYWENCTGLHGTTALLCLKHIVTAMVDNGTLRACRLLDELNRPEMVDTLVLAGMIVLTDNGRYIQFRHDILFDYAVAQVWLNPRKIASGRQHFPKDDQRGLILAPAVAFVLREIWDSEPGRSQFWRAVVEILTCNNVDPIIEITTARASVEYPIVSDDTKWIVERIAANDAKAIETLRSIKKDLVVRLRERPEIPFEPWITLLAGLTANVAMVAEAARYLLHHLIELVDVGPAAPIRKQLGLLARALLKYAYGLDEAMNLASNPIKFVADTYETDPHESRRLLSAALEPEQIRKSGCSVVWILCLKAKEIARVDPEFCAEIYRSIYTLKPTEIQTTSLETVRVAQLSDPGGSLEMATDTLAVFFPDFLEKHPVHAVRAIVGAVERIDAQDYPSAMRQGRQKLEVNGREIEFYEDSSHLWAHNPDRRGSRRSTVLIGALVKHLTCSTEEVAVRVANLLIDEASSAIFWSRLFLVAVKRDDALIDLLLPFATNEQFLVSLETQKDAVDVVAKGYRQLSLDQRQNLEGQVLTFNSLGGTAFKASFLRRFFCAIGSDAATSGERFESITKNATLEEIQNERPLVFRRIVGGEEQAFCWIPNLDRSLPANAKLLAALEAAKQELKLDSTDQLPSGLTLNALFDTLGRVGGGTCQRQD